VRLKLRKGVDKQRAEARKMVAAKIQDVEVKYVVVCPSSAEGRTWSMPVEVEGLLRGMSTPCSLT